MRGLIKNTFPMARMFMNTVRYMYIDDLLTLHNPSSVAEIVNISPPALVLKKTTKSTTVVSYVDITSTISENNYPSSVCDKRDAFNLKIVNLPFMDSTIPTKTSVHVPKVVRMVCVCESFFLIRL